MSSHFLTDLRGGICGDVSGISHFNPFIYMAIHLSPPAPNVKSSALRWTFCVLARPPAERVRRGTGRCRGRSQDFASRESKVAGHFCRTTDLHSETAQRARTRDIPSKWRAGIREKPRIKWSARGKPALILASKRVEHVAGGDDCVDSLVQNRPEHNLAEPGSRLDPTAVHGQLMWIQRLADTANLISRRRQHPSDLEKLRVANRIRQPSFIEGIAGVSSKKAELHASHALGTGRAVVRQKHSLLRFACANVHRRCVIRCLPRVRRNGKASSHDAAVLE